MKRFTAGLLLLFLALLPAAQAEDGAALIKDSLARHDTPFEYEEITLTLKDGNDHETIRRGRRYSRKENDQDAMNKYLLVFDEPVAIRGVALLSWQGRGVGGSNWIYLPALDKYLRRLSGGGGGGGLFGSDFSAIDLMGEMVKNQRYEIESKSPTHVILIARPNGELGRRLSEYQYRRLHINQANQVIDRIDYFDKAGRPLKRRTSLEVAEVTKGIFRPRQVRMENLRDRHQTLITVTRRSFSADAVPEVIFSRDWISDGRHLQRSPLHPAPQVN